MNYKTKIFHSTFGRDSINADMQFNEWIKDNSNIKILNFKYQQARYGGHSICILYTEEDNK